MSDDTIFALSSGALPSGVAVIRISGPATRATLTELCGRVSEARHARLLSIRSRNGEALDRGLVLFFPAPASFTGEDSAELQIHGGRATVKAVLAALGAIDGLREAEAGEFTRRAFLNGKMDLVAVEGLADLVAAETEMQRRLAAEQAAGGLSKLYGSWARRLTHARAMIEAELDFSEEEDVPGSVAASIWQDMQRLCGEIVNHIAAAGTGEIVRDGLRVVIAGPPNAGKSSLLNALAKRDVAIVTDVPGTTRDVLHVDLDLGGFAVRLYDTAGLRETEDPVEREGIRRTHLSLSEAHLLLLLSDRPDGGADIRELYQGPIICVGTKADQHAEPWPMGAADVVISAKTGSGISDLLSAIADHLPELSAPAALALPTRRRHLENLRAVKDNLDLAIRAVDRGLDIRAEYLRRAAHALGRMTGHVDAENLLDVIFSEFCIGK